MKLISLRRKLNLYRQIHQFNTIDNKWLEPSWRNTIESNNLTNTYYSVEDRWLQLLSLPIKQFERIMRLSVLFAIYSDNTLLISGKHLQALHLTFTPYELKQATQINKINNATNSNINNNKTNDKINNKINNNNPVPLALFNDTDWVLCSAYKITSLIYMSKNIAMRERYKLRFRKNLVVSNTANDYWSKFNVLELEQYVLLAMKHICPSSFKLL